MINIGTKQKSVSDRNIVAYHTFKFKSEEVISYMYFIKLLILLKIDREKWLPVYTTSFTLLV